MTGKRTIWITGVCCVLLYLLSICFFLAREKTGNYHKLVSYEELYSKKANTPSKLRKWKNVLGGLVSGADLRQGRELTVKYAGVTETDPPFTKMKKIAAWIHASYRHCPLGEPNAAFSALSLIDQHYAASRAESAIWCGTFGTHFLFFCSANGLTSRLVETNGENDQHIVNETWIPELNQWVFTDLTFNTVYCKDARGRILNTVDILRMNEQKSSPPMPVLCQEDGDQHVVTAGSNQEIWQKYFNRKSRLMLYYSIDQEQVLTTGNKLLRYAFPVAWYETYSLTPPSNTAFFLRIVSLYLGVIMTILFIVLYLKRND